MLDKMLAADAATALLYAAAREMAACYSTVYGASAVRNAVVSLRRYAATPDAFDAIDTMRYFRHARARGLCG